MSATETPKLLDKQIDRLYGLPLDEFTAARNELAKGLRASGDRDGAEEVRTLEKPSLPAWVANQLARQHQREVRALLDAVDDLRAAQERALGGAGADDVRSAQEAERTALRALGEGARELLRSVGRRSPGTVERVVTTLRAAAADPEARPLLEQGRLTHEVASSGFPRARCRSARSSRAEAAQDRPGCGGAEAGTRAGEAPPGGGARAAPRGAGGGRPPARGRARARARGARGDRRARRSRARRGGARARPGRRYGLTRPR